jgi:6-phosphogluconolactonase
MELVVKPIAELRARISHQFEELVAATLEQPTSIDDEAVTCGITGGATALIFLGALREAHAEWSRVTLFWGDERAVPPDDEDSNFGLAERLLLSPLGANAPSAIRMPADDPNPHAAARRYAEHLPQALDLLILGVGDDGHVCSLFPGHRALVTEDQRVTFIEDAPKAPRRRMTLTLPYVLAARHIWVIAVGPRKEPVMRQAIRQQAASTPLDLVVAQGRNVTIFTDLPLQPEG